MNNRLFILVLYLDKFFIFFCFVYFFLRRDNNFIFKLVEFGFVILFYIRGVK